MNTRIVATEFELCIAMGDLVIWPDESDIPQMQHYALQEIFDVLGAKIDLLPIIKKYFDDAARVGRGDVHVYDIDYPDSIFAIDLYNEPTDQLDLIRIYIRCKRELSAKISELVWGLFNDASIQVYVSQQAISVALRHAIDNSKFPRIFADSNFSQVQIRYQVA